MRAVVMTRPGGPEVLELREVPDPAPGKGEVLVSVAATAVNRADLIQRRGFYPAPPGSPADILGLEFAGRVEALGDGVCDLAIGDRVMGIVGGGGYAEKVVLPARQTVPVPRDLPLERAAAIPEAFMTAWDALVPQAELAMGQWLLVHAVASGVGTAAVQLARAVGARTIGTSRSAAKLEACRDLGLDHGIHVGPDGFAEQVAALAPGGVDVVLDLVGAAYLAQSLRALRTRGRLVVVGLVAGAEAPLDLGLLLRRRLRVQGTALRTRPDEEKAHLAQRFAEATLPLFERGSLAPVVDRVLPMADVREAHALMERNENTGKIVLAW